MDKMTVTFFLLAGFTLAVLHFLSIELYLYWRFSWLDIPMHILGGATVALGLFAGVALKWPVPKRWLRLVPTLLIVLTAALGWEVFELYAGIPILDDYVADTVSDLAAGLIGGLIGCFIGNRFSGDRS